MGERRAMCRILLGKLEGKRSLGRPRRRWEDNINIDHTIITPTKCTLLSLKAPDITICTLCLIFCTYMFQLAWVIFRGLNTSAWLKLLLITIY
jgi:hypothetical protein